MRTFTFEGGPLSADRVGKHGTHDQKSHGNWATGGRDEMRFNGNIPGEWGWLSARDNDTMSELELKITESSLTQMSERGMSVYFASDEPGADELRSVTWALNAAKHWEDEIGLKAYPDQVIIHPGGAGTPMASMWKEDDGTFTLDWYASKMAEPSPRMYDGRTFAHTSNIDSKHRDVYLHELGHMFNHKVTTPKAGNWTRLEISEIGTTLRETYGPLKGWGSQYADTYRSGNRLLGNNAEYFAEAVLATYKGIELPEGLAEDIKFMTEDIIKSKEPALAKAGGRHELCAGYTVTEEVEKHGTHDQKSHGNWARGGGGYTEVPASEFIKGFSEARAGEFGVFLSPFTEEDFDQPNIRLFSSHGGKVGGALTDHGDGRIEIGSLFALEGAPEGSGRALMNQMIDAGGNWLNNFDGILTEMYQKKGFSVKTRDDWNDEYAPEGWDYDRFNNPDYVTMGKP